MGAILTIGAGFTIGGDAPRTVVSTLAETGEVDCQPALPFFCSNVHVGCSGRSTTRTFAFTLRASRSHGWIEAVADISGIVERYENGRVDWGRQGDYVILRPHAANGYIKMLADGSYSFRHYSQDIGMMSYGHCK